MIDVYVLPTYHCIRYLRVRVLIYVKIINNYTLNVLMHQFSLSVLIWHTYSGVRMRFYVYVSFCVSTTTKRMKTNNIPLKSPIKLPPEMQKIFWIFQNLLVFRVFFEKAVVLENGQIWNHPVNIFEWNFHWDSLKMEV